MNWFRGSIPEAIGASRSKKTIFVVVVTSDDETSSQLLSNLEAPNIAEFFSNFVTISLKNGSVEAQQFGQLYPLVVIPSIYLIGLEGSPLEVIGGLVDPAVLLSRAQKALELHLASQNTPVPAQVQSSVQPLVQPVQPVQPQVQPPVQPQVQPPVQPQVQPLAAATNSPPESPVLSNNEQENNESEAVSDQKSGESETPLVQPLEKRVEKANELLAALRKKKEDEEREKEKTEERERRELGKQLQQFKQAQQEREQRELAESRQKQKREEKEALEKIRQQIAQDKADRAARYQTAQAAEEERRKAAQIAQEQLKQERAAVAAARSAFTRLQFRLPDGSTRTDQFASDQHLIDVANYIDREIQPPFKTYSLCTTFPRRQFTGTDMHKSLLELDLTPSAALLIVPSTPTNSNAALSAPASSWMNRLYSTISFIWNWVTSFIFPPTPALNVPAPSNPPPQQPNNQGGVRRRGNTANSRRLVDASGDDSDDNATWNGNSTQQL